MGQSKAHQWIHVLLVCCGRRSARWAMPRPGPDGVGERLGVAEAEAAAMVEPTATLPAAAPAPCRLPPLVATMAPNGASSAPRIQLSRRAVKRQEKVPHVKNVRLINAALTILFLSETYVGSTHDKRIADATPYPLPAGSRFAPRSGASWRSSLDRSRSSCRPGSREAGPSRAPKKLPIGASRVAACASNTQQPCQALSHRPRHLPPSEDGRPRSGHEVLLCRCITFGCVSPHGNQWFIGMNSIEFLTPDFWILPQNRTLRTEPRRACNRDKISRNA